MFVFFVAADEGLALALLLWALARVFRHGCSRRGKVRLSGRGRSVCVYMCVVECSGAACLPRAKKVMYSWRRIGRVS